MSCKPSRLALILTLALSSIVTAEDLSEPQDIVKRAAQALKQTRTVRYDANLTREGWVAQFVPEVRGTMIIGPTAKYDVPRYLAEIEIKKGDSEEVTRLTCGCNGDEYFLIDTAAKTAYSDMDPAVMGAHARSSQRLILGAFTEDEPLADTIGAKALTLGKPVTVESEDCYTVLAVVEGAQEKSIEWAISKKDFLPRRVTRTYTPFSGEGDDGTTQLTLSKLVANPKLANSQFDLVLPVGFTRSDDFAP